MAFSHIALLRGINVGGKHVLPMAQLKTFFAAAKCTDVTTYIQSGNVVFNATPAQASKVSALVAQHIARDCGFESPVIVRSAAQLDAVVRKMPLRRVSRDEATWFVAFLADKPTAAAVERLDLKRSPHDTVIVQGQEVYLNLGKGVSGSKITNAYLDSKLGTVCTVRNWRTVLKLLSMCQG